MTEKTINNSLALLRCANLFIKEARNFAQTGRTRPRDFQMKVTSISKNKKTQKRLLGPFFRPFERCHTNTTQILRH